MSDHADHGKLWAKCGHDAPRAELVFCARDNRLMVFDRAAAEIPESVKARGIVDRATGIERARASRQWLQDAAWNALKRTDQLQTSHFLIMGLATRAAGLHDGAVHAL